MSNIKIDIDEISNSLVQSFGKYTDEISEKVVNLTKQNGNLLVEKVRNDSPVRTGKYKKGWKIRIELKKDRCSIKGVNTDKPSITNVLENGHTGKGNKRTKAYPHIRSNEKKYNEKLLNEIEELLK